MTSLQIRLPRRDAKEIKEIAKMLKITESAAFIEWKRKKGIKFEF